MSAQQVGASFGGVVPVPDQSGEESGPLGLRYIVPGSAPGEYVIRFPKSMLDSEAPAEQMVEIPIELLNLGDPILTWDVARVGGKLPYRYSYVMRNGPAASRAIWSWALVVPAEDNSTTLRHPLWRPTSPAALATNAPIAPRGPIAAGPELRRSASLGKFASWTTSADQNPIRSGEAMGQFVADSAFRPGWTNAYASAGRGIEVPFEMPAEVYRDFAILQRPENEQSIVLTIGPKFGPDVSPQWIAADWNLAVQKLVVRGGLSAQSAYVSELLEALEQLATAETPWTLQLQATPAQGMERKLHAAIMLALEP